MISEAELDLECMHNWFLVGITDTATGQEWDYQMIPGSKLDVSAITALCQHYTLITFNGTNYDIPMLMLALAGADCATLKAANDAIITKGLKWWQFYKTYNCYPPDWLKHIDISEVAPGVRISLKQYACRMHSKLVQDTPVDFNLPLPLERAPEEIYYCRNDRRVTHELREVVADRLAMRERLSARFGVDLRSKSDAQMAEAMVKAEWSRRMADSLARFQADAPTSSFPLELYPHLSVQNIDVDYRGIPRPVVPHYSHGTEFKATIPEYINFATPGMQEFLNVVRNCTFVISDKDEAHELGQFDVLRTGVVIPAELKGRDIVIGRTTYRVGIGGLHSQESGVAYRSIPGVHTLTTADVASYYPSLILNANMRPQQLGKLFPVIYKSFYDERIAAKRNIEKYMEGSDEYVRLATVRDGFKIVLNGTFGKLFSRYSIFYAPEFGIAVTIGGQLSLLMLIERLELAGIHVVSANTDGIEMLVPEGREWIARSIIDWWQRVTSLVMEQSTYLGLYSRDVNNYISLHFDGTVKRKGIFGKSGVLKNKHPDLDICADAVVALLATGTPLQETIYACQDVRKFIRVRGAKGGAIWFRKGQDMFVNGSIQGGVLMGRAVRWYYKKDSQDYIVDAKSLNKVAGSDGACPIMELPETLPTDIDLRYYVSVAEKMLEDIAYNRENQ